MRWFRRGAKRVDSTTFDSDPYDVARWLNNDSVIYLSLTDVPNRYELAVTDAAGNPVIAEGK